MSKTHWLQSPNKNYLGHWDLPEEGDLILTIKSAQWEAVENPILRTEESCRVIRFEEEGIKPFICNQTNAQSIIKSTGIKYMEDSHGGKIALYESKTKVKKEEVACVRIRRKSVASMQKPAKQQSISDERFVTALESVEKGEYSAEELNSRFKLTKQQSNSLTELILQNGQS